MHERQPTPLERLLGRLLRARARRDRQPRFSDPWHAADAEMHAIERAIFRLPLGEATSRRARRPDPRPPRPIRQDEHLADDDLYDGEMAG